MKEQILSFVVSKLITGFLAKLDPDSLMVQLDILIDSVEDHVLTTPNKFDDELLPVLKFVRDLFQITDLPDK